MAGLLDWLQTPQGIGLLSAIAGGAATAQRGTPWNNFGRGAVAGLTGYSEALNQANQQGDQDLARRYKTMQMQQIEDTIAKAKAEKEWRAGLPAVREMARTKVEPFQPDDPFNQGAEAFGEVYGGEQHGQQVDPAMLNVQPGDPQALQDYMMRPESPYAERLIEQEIFPKPKAVKEWQKVNIEGRVLYAPFFQDGTVGQPVPYDVAEKLNFQDTGSEIRGLNPFTGAQTGSAIQKTMTPGERASSAVARERLALDRTKANESKAPSGYRYNAQGGLEPIPGGPADIKAGELGQKRAIQRETFKAQSDNVISAIGEAKKLISHGTAGLGGTLARLPMTNARNLAAKLSTIKANIGFDRLQLMREASPTGGALGQVAIQELEALQASIASLDQLQSPQELRGALDKIERHYKNWQRTLAADNEPMPGGRVKFLGFE